MSQKYYAIVTNLGAAKIANAAALGTKLSITQMAVGDGGGTLPTPNASQTALISEKRRAAINTLSIDPANASQVIAEQVIPENEGGFWIREMGLFDADGTLIAVCNTPETYKPALQEGSGRTQTVRMILIVNSTDAITLKIDPSVVLATRKYVEDGDAAAKEYAGELMEAHQEAKDPHDQYLRRDGRIEYGDAGTGIHSADERNKCRLYVNSDGTAGAWNVKENRALPMIVAPAQKKDEAVNLGQLSGAAFREVGTGSQQIPDMSNWTSGPNWRRTPDGYIEQWGISAQTYSDVSVVFPIPFAVGADWIAEHDRNGGSKMTLWQFNNITKTGFQATNVASVSKGDTALGSAVQASCLWFARGK